MPPLLIRVLGAPSAQVDGREIVVDTRKATALLAYLAVEPGAHRRDTLAHLLWPEYEHDRARAALRRTLSTLRSALGGRFVDVTRDAVSLDRSALSLDTERFRELAGAQSTAALEEAAALHRGPFLAGFALRDSVVFDDWQSLEAGLLARELGVVLDRLAASLVRDGDLSAALQHAERRLALDPLHEPAHYRLIELYARNGDRQAALSQYRDCVRRLHRELGVAPLEATTELYRSIREGTTATRIEPTKAPAPPSGARPLVGRDDELRALQAAHGEVGASGKLVVVEGEVGIGKTRLLDELVGWARREGSAVIAVRSFEHEASLAYGSAIELLRGALRDGSPTPVPPGALAEAARLLPELGPPPLQPLDEPGAAVRFYEGIVGTLLAATAGAHPALLVVDDVHWADASSLEVLAYLARRLGQRPVLLVLSWRPEDTPTDHPARRVLAEAQRDGLGSTIRLGRLDRADVDRLVAAAGAAPDISARLFEETQGVPFYIDEYLDAGPHEWSLPAGVRELLEARLATASEIGAQVLATAAVLGRTFDADTVRDVSGRSDEEVVGALDELIARGILAELEGPAYDFRHEQARKVAYERTSTGRRRLLHGRAADVLAARARVGASAASICGSPAEAWRLPVGSTRPASRRVTCTRMPRRLRTSGRRSRSGTRTSSRCSARSATCRHSTVGTAMRSRATRRRRRSPAMTSGRRSNIGSGSCITAGATGNWRRIRSRMPCRSSAKTSSCAPASSPTGA